MIAIYDRPGSYSERWIEICQSRKIPFYLVDLFDSNLIATVKKNNTTLLLCHPPMAHRASMIALKSIIRALNLAGVNTFPSDAEFWHFDDKLAQKYLLEALGILSPKTHAFYELTRAENWIESQNFPAVFKLRGGAGSSNVFLLKDQSDAQSYARRMFAQGIPVIDSPLNDIGTRYRIHKKKGDWIALAKRLPKTMLTWWNSRKTIDRDRGYFYVQEFIPGNLTDTRITVIGSRAFGFNRKVRPGDFRASGSGEIDYDKTAIDIRCVSMAFDAARLLKTRCMAFDFVYSNADCSPMIVEMSFGFKSAAVFDCPGYWQPDLTWCEGHNHPEDLIFNDLTKALFER